LLVAVEAKPQFLGLVMPEPVQELVMMLELVLELLAIALLSTL
jgi:hypothetical protein